TSSQCEVPKDPRYPECPGKVDWMRARWTSDPCYAFYGVDGSDCSFLVYLSEVEWFCPPLAWRNHSSQPSPQHVHQAAFRTDLSMLLDQIGAGKESLSFMKRRIRRLAPQWTTAANRLDAKLEHRWRDQKKVARRITAICRFTYLLFFNCGSLFFFSTETAAVNDEKVCLSLQQDAICHIRVIDTFGTEPAYNHEEYATLHGYRTNWGYWNLNARQYMTMFPHTPDNSFMGFVSEELNETEKRSIQQSKVNSMAVVYGKEASMWKGKEGFLQILHKYMEVHGTVYYETQRPPEVPAFVKNHGLLPQHELQQLLRKAKVKKKKKKKTLGEYVPVVVCIIPGHSILSVRAKVDHGLFAIVAVQVSSQHPYAEQYIGSPHVITVDYNNSAEFDTAIREIMRRKVEPYLPYEYTCEGMLERVHAYIQQQVRPWPPLSSLRLLVSEEGESCVEACRSHGFICEPAHFRFINNKEALRRYGVLDSEMNHILPAFSVLRRECGLQREPLLFSCAGHSPKYRRVCPCRDFRRGQVALCRDCL
uniref:alpha-1,6-mannosyl-glycoprotein 6-beta-N-acetylglucosaminyltransferase n=1 Tax=Hippocampus comes TaxID=109280 RepID=A0A3Q2YB72_HIPCM